MDGIEVIFQEGNQIPLTNNETLMFTLFFVLFFVFILFGIRFLANFFATYEVRHQILDEEMSKLQGILKTQNTKSEIKEPYKKHLPDVDFKKEQKFYLLHNSLHIRSPHNTRILKFSLLNLSIMFLLLLITGVTFFTKPYELEVINKNEAYLNYYLQKNRLIKKENWKLLEAVTKDDFCQIKIKDISKNKDEFYSLYIPQPRCNDLKRAIK